MTTTVDQALALWGLTSAPCTLIAARENAVYNVTTHTQSFALRLHRQGYRTDAELRSELQWMGVAATGGLKVPAPIASQTGDMLHVVNGVQVDVLQWLSGVTMDETLTDLPRPNRAALFKNLGRTMARLHTVSDAWQPPLGFTRCAWNRDGFLGESPLWDRFWDNPALSPEERTLFLAMRAKANSHLTELQDTLDYGLIHADLVAANVMVDGPNLQLIDFDDGGYGFRLFEIATALLKHLDAPDYPALKKALIDGYHSVRPLDLKDLDLFLLLRAATYVGWNITRMAEPGAQRRNERFIATAKHLASSYLAS